MIQRAGIALSRLAYDAEFAITQVDRDSSPTFLPSTHHRLFDSHTVDDIVNTFHGTVGFDGKLDFNGFTVSLPIGASSEQRVAFSSANNHRWCTHFEAWANSYAQSVTESRIYAYILFIDLTPGQVASEALYGGIEDGRWIPIRDDTSNARLGTDIIESLSIDDVYSRLVRPIVHRNVKLYQVGILRPEGAFPDLSAKDMEDRFPSTPVQWVTLEQVSYGAAIIMNREHILPEFMQSSSNLVRTRISTGIAVADGKVVTVVPRQVTLPIQQVVFFTTSQDDQATATAQLCLDAGPCAEVTLKGLTPRLKGEAVIKVTLNIAKYGRTAVTMKEIGGNLQIEKVLGPVLDPYPSTTDVREANKESTGEQVEMTLGKDGVIGELPE
jgi:hypothetical protein